MNIVDNEIWSISKDFDFCYGHRVWSQTLDLELSLNSPCKCRHLHGHQAKVTVYMDSNFLKDGMVTDFNNLSWLKKFIDDNIDHKFIIDKHDPLFEKMLGCKFEVEKFIAIYIPNTKNIIAYVLDSKSNNEILEYEQSFLVVDFIPTSENFSKWLHFIAKTRMENIKISGVDWWETPKSVSRYRIL